MVSPNVVRSAAGRCSRGRQCRLRRSAAHSPGDTHRIFNRSVGRPNATQRCRGSHELASDGCNPSSRPSSHAAARRCPRTFTSGGGKREGTRAPDAIADISRIDERRLGSVICHRGSDILAITSAIQRRQSRMCCKCFQRDARVPVSLSHAPDVTAARIVVPCSTRPSASATNNQESEPVSCSASRHLRWRPTWAGNRQSAARTAGRPLARRNRAQGQDRRSRKTGQLHADACDLRRQR